MFKNCPGQKIGAQLVSATDGSAFTGSVTVAVTGDAGTQATGSVGSGACTHEGNGYHTYAPAQAETNYDLIAFTFTGTGAVPVTVQVETNDRGDRTWYVSSSGSSSNHGRNRDNPVDTYATALARASDGDTIRLMAGTHNKSSVSSPETTPRNITVEGDGWESIVNITGTQIGGFYLQEANWTFRNFKIIRASTSSIPIYSLSGGDNMTIEYMNIDGRSDAINIQSASGLVVRHNVLTSNWDVVVATCDNSIVEYNSCASTCDHPSATQVTGIYVPSSGSCRHNKIALTAAESTDRDLFGIQYLDSGGAMAIEHNSGRLVISHASNGGKIYGVAFYDDTATQRAFTVSDNHWHRSTAGGGDTYDIAALDGTDFVSASALLSVVSIGGDASDTIGTVQSVDVDVSSTKTRALLSLPAVAAAANGGLPTVNASNQVAGVAAGVTLADDAITASKFDESTAFPVKSTDTGDTTILRKGSGSVTGTSINTALSGAATRPAWLKRIPGSRTLTVGTRRDTGETDVSGNIRMKAGEGPLPWLITFDRTQLAQGDVLDDAEAPIIGGEDAANCTIDSTEGVGWAMYALTGTGVVVLPTIAADAETTDEIYIDLEVAPEPGESLTVRVTVEVIE